MKRQSGSHRLWCSPTGFRLPIQPGKDGKAKAYRVEQFLKQVADESESEKRPAFRRLQRQLKNRHFNSGKTEVAMTIQVDLSPQLEDMVTRKIASGLYASADEVVREALRIMEAQDHSRAAKLEQLRRDISDGLESGELEPWNPEDIKQAGRARRTQGV